MTRTSKHLSAILSLLLMLIGSPARPHAQTPAPVEARMNDVLKFFCTPPNSYDTYFSKELLSHVSAEQLNAAFTRYCGGLGSPVKVEPVKIESPNQRDFQFALCEGSPRASQDRCRCS